MASPKRRQRPTRREQYCWFSWGAKMPRPRTWKSGQMDPYWERGWERCEPALRELLGPKWYYGGATAVCPVLCEQFIPTKAQEYAKLYMAWMPEKKHHLLTIDLALGPWACKDSLEEIDRLRVLAALQAMPDTGAVP